MPKRKNNVKKTKKGRIFLIIIAVLIVIGIIGSAVK